VDFGLGGREMKKRLLIVFVLVLFSIFLTSSCKSKAKEPIPEPDWDILNTQKWDDEFYKLVPPPTEDGKAATYFLEAIHSPLINREMKREIYPWLESFTENTWKSNKPEDIKLTRKGIQIPELDLIVKGSLQKNYQIFGIYYMPSAKPGFFDIGPKGNIYKYMLIKKLSFLLMARADYKFSHGDFVGAEKDMFAAIRMGHIFQRDITTFGYSLGNYIEKIVAKEMPLFYKKLGNEEKSKSWANFQKKAEQHKTANAIYYRYYFDRKSESMMNIVDNKSLPRAIRIDSLIGLVMNPLLENPLRIAFLYFPKKTKEFILKEHFDDPEMVIVQFKLIENVYVTPKEVGKMVMSNEKLPF